MALELPNLDDRTFQDLVDDAKRLVQARNPHWTDHNVSDPGVTLIEAFAGMMETFFYRLNRAPDRLYDRFLDRMGEHRRGPTAARIDLDIRLTAPALGPVVLPVDSVAATEAGADGRAIEFTTLEPLVMRPVQLRECGRQLSDGGAVSLHMQSLDPDGVGVGRDFESGFIAFADRLDAVPAEGAALLVALSDPAPRCIVRLDIDCGRAEGDGVDPDDPPYVWEALCGGGWRPCDRVGADTTMALNTSGAVEIVVPDGHVSATVGGIAGGWLRARLRSADERGTGPAGGPAGSPVAGTYRTSPRVRRLVVSTVGGRVPAANARVVRDEHLGVTTGEGGDRFRLSSTPVVVGLPVEFEAVASPEARRRGAPASRSTVDDGLAPPVDESTGEVTLGPTLVPAGSSFVASRYYVGGGAAGNVAAGAITRLHRALPYAGQVVNVRAARGGTDGETVRDVERRGPTHLRTGARAVTADDFAQLVPLLAPELRQGRVQVVPLRRPVGDRSGASDVVVGVRVLLVPAPSTDAGPRPVGDFALLEPDDALIRRLAEELDRVRFVGTELEIAPPTYQGVTVVARVQRRGKVDPEILKERVTRALDTYLDPLIGGREGTGWPFGRDVAVGDLYSFLLQLEGVDQVDLKLYRADPRSLVRSHDEVNRIEVGPDSLVFPVNNKVYVPEASPP